jgi:hypothetical protein
MTHGATDPSDFQRIPIKDFFDFSRAEDRVGRSFVDMETFVSERLNVHRLW